MLCLTTAHARPQFETLQYTIANAHAQIIATINQALRAATEAVYRAQQAAINQNIAQSLYAAQQAQASILEAIRQAQAGTASGPPAPSAGTDVIPLDAIRKRPQVSAGAAGQTIVATGPGSVAAAGPGVAFSSSSSSSDTLRGGRPSGQTIVATGPGTVAVSGPGFASASSSSISG